MGYWVVQFDQVVYGGYGVGGDVEYCVVVQCYYGWVDVGLLDVVDEDIFGQVYYFFQFKVIGFSGCIRFKSIVWVVGCRGVMGWWLKFEWMMLFFIIMVLVL